ncbi:hypothetical protein M441DRAFT_44189 [Trichoderma asperellum CBS 433.97]|uniref:Uncharacterized protein n=1 Tax=Trichoderma asperellum (strain ATCC 204424 / CBS 433.97 / NBRC 101777) TaxID=1042311 RepID=A0A2T3ZH16_TRIA4|nr:hypothetical protein M441DRAFT_44189 [Trichoderma asperellum CBS 433.97]PTB44089.1 hypothetical protein M441DRAFT_44189 [Trichoderma asperellum CBS 433.97]
MRAAAARPVDEKPAARCLSQRRPSAKNSVDFCADGEYRDDGEIRLPLLLSVAGASDHRISPRQVGRGWWWIPRGHHGNNTSFETRGARLPLAAKPKDGLHSSCVSASSQRQARRQSGAHRASVVPLLCVWVCLADGTDYESRRTHRRTQQNFLPQPCGQRPVWEEAKMAQGASWRAASTAACGLASGSSAPSTGYTRGRPLGALFNHRNMTMCPCPTAPVHPQKMPTKQVRKHGFTILWLIKRDKAQSQCCCMSQSMPDKPSPARCTGAITGDWDRLAIALYLLPGEHEPRFCFGLAQSTSLTIFQPGDPNRFFALKISTLHFCSLAPHRCQNWIRCPP